MRKKIISMAIVSMFLLVCSNVVFATTQTTLNKSNDESVEITLYGFIKDQDSGNSIKDVTVSLTRSFPFFLSTTTDQNGYYIFTFNHSTDEDCEYKLQSRHQDYRTHVHKLKFTEPYSNYYTYSHDLVLLPYHIHGYIRDQDSGNPINGAEIVIDKSFPRRIGYTDKNGYYSIRFGPDDIPFLTEFHISISKSGYQTEQEWIKCDGYEYNYDWSILFIGYPPDKPEITLAPDEIIRGKEYEIQVTTTDPDNNDVYYQFSWDGTKDDLSIWYGPYSSGETCSVTNIWNDWNPDLKIKVRAKDVNEYSQTSSWSEQKQVTMINQAPEQPSKPEIIDSKKLRKTYTFITSSTDPDRDQLYYLFDWGDGTDSGWLGPYESGESCEAEHKFEDHSRNYYVKVQAIDDPNRDGDLLYGIRSEWSDTSEGSLMPKPRAINPIFNNALARLLGWGIIKTCFQYY